jgi:hypothetical protein
MVFRGFGTVSCGFRDGFVFVGGTWFRRGFEVRSETIIGDTQDR